MMGERDGWQGAARLGEPADRPARGGARPGASLAAGGADEHRVAGGHRSWAGQLGHGQTRCTLIPHPDGGARPVWWLGLPFDPKDTPNLNRREHWAKEARLRREWRQAVALMARSARIPAYERVLVALHYAPAMIRRRDPDNLVAALKPAVDGLVDAGVIPDDTPEFVVRDMPIIEPPITLPPFAARLALYIERLA